MPRPSGSAQLRLTVIHWESWQMNLKKDWIEGWKVVARLVWFNIVAGLIFIPLKCFTSLLIGLNPESQVLSVGAVLLALVLLVAFGPLCFAYASKATVILGSSEADKLGPIARAKFELKRVRGEE